MFSINANKHKIIWEMQFLVILGYCSIHLYVEILKGKDVVDPVAKV